MQAPVSPAAAAEKQSSPAPRVINILPYNRLSSLLSQKHLPLLAAGGFRRKPRVATRCHAYSTTEDSSSRPIGRYPVPNKKDMPYDIVELMEEVEVKVKSSPCKILSVANNHWHALSETSAGAAEILRSPHTGLLSEALFQPTGQGDPAGNCSVKITSLQFIRVSGRSQAVH